MKILFTTFTYYPEQSGVSVVVQYLAEGLARIGHDVTVVTRINGGKSAKQEVLNNVKVFRFDISQTIFKNIVGETDNYINFISNNDCDVIIMECLQCHTTDILLPYLKDMKCKKVIHAHGAPGILMKPFGWEGDWFHTIGHTHNWLRWHKYYQRIFPKYAQYVDAGISISLCASDLDYFSRHLKNVYIVENSANDMFFDETQYNKEISTILSLQSNRYILNISNYSDRKNQILLIKSFVEADLKDTALVLIGSQNNAYFKKAKRYADSVAETTGTEIVMLHNIDREYFPSIIYHASLFAMTSKWEEYPVSLVEAMAVGTPFLSTPVGNAHTLPGGVTSRFDSEIPLLLRTLLNNREVLMRLGQQGKQYATQCNTLNKIIQRYEAVLRKITSKYE